MSRRSNGFTSHNDRVGGCGLIRAWLARGGYLQHPPIQPEILIQREARLAIWLVAFVIDLATPWAAVDHTVRVPPHPMHLPERFGLFTLILLGEPVVAVMKGIESQETWSLQAAGSALAGLGALFGVWWWYFHRARAADARVVRTRGDAMRLQLWTYAHCPLYLAIVVVGVGIQRVVTMATHEPMPASDLTMWMAGTALLVAAMWTIWATAGTPDRLMTADVSLPDMDAAFSSNAETAFSSGVEAAFRRPGPSLEPTINCWSHGSQ